MQIVLFFAVSVMMFSLIALVFAPSLLRPSAEAERILDVVRSNRPDQRRISKHEQVQESLLKAAQGLRVTLGLAENKKLKQRLLNAGFRNPKASDVFFGVQCVTPACQRFRIELHAGQHALLDSGGTGLRVMWLRISG